jgi:chromosome segregation ATPase
MLELARGLEAADEAVAASIAEVDELQHDTELLRRRGHELEAVRAELPAAREAAAAALGELAREVERRDTEAERAEAALARANESGREDAVAEARRSLTRARDLAASARRRVERAREEERELERRAAEAEREAVELDGLAREIAGRLASVGRGSAHAAQPPEPGLESALAWADRARAALLVVRSGLDTERERLVRQANELAASALGEPYAATSVSGVRERLERARG